ncbi:MAG: hypothetical protein H0V49_12605 [Nocardioidaceae bacterium]|nr:hypothetical protein [Nocardioidaceae bacterium]
MSITMAPTRLITARPAAAVVPALAQQEARRLLRHPLMMLGFAFFVGTAGVSLFTDNPATAAFSMVDAMPSFYPGVFAILAASLTASRDHRAGSDELVAPLPGRAFERVLALCLASVAPALLMLIFVLLLHAGYVSQGVYVDTPNVWHLTQGAVTVLGGCLFGVMVGTWAPTRSAALFALVLMVIANLWVNAGGGPHELFGLSMGWGQWGSPDGRVWGGLAPGSPMGHVVYLLGLCGMAATAALLRVADRRTPVVVAGFVSVALAVAGGIGQLP